jgi:DNA-directed RNA polymerase subunit RPC12/RpoP
MTEAAAEGSTSRRDFPCRQCGAKLLFVPGTDVIRCSYCGSENPIPAATGGIEELDFRAAVETLGKGEDLEEQRTIECGSCAASFRFDPHLHAAACPYCGGPIVTDTGSHRLFRPRALVPFRLTDKEAQERLRGWLGSLWFAPSRLREYAREEGRLTGVYLPYWTFDADTRSEYYGERGIAYQVPRSVVTRVQGRLVRRTQYVVEIRWTPVRGAVARFFDDVLVLASRTLPDRVIERLGSWRLDELVPYREEYLSGFRSETYQVELADGFAEAQAAMERTIRRDVAADIGGDAQRIHHLDTRYSQIRFKHVLLPVWAAAYRYQGKPYRFVVNGQTGEVQGERPYSWIKIAAAVAVAAVAAAALAFAYLQTQGPAAGF